MTIIIFYTRNRGFLSQFYEDLSIRLSLEGHHVYNFSLKTRDHFETNNEVSLIINKKEGYFKNYYKIYQIIKSVRPDVILSNFSYSNPALLFGKVLGVKHNLIWFHTLINQMNFTPSNIYIKSKFLNLATTIITNSQELKNEVIEKYHQNPIKVKNLPFTTSIISTIKKEISLIKSNEKIYIGCPGRIHPDKNQDLLLDVVYELNNPNLMLVFAGNKQSNFIENHKNYIHLENQIVHLGNLSSEEMVDFYQQMDVIVLPSLNEAFGLVLIEALACGCKTLVSSRFGAVDYIKDDISSITFNPLDKYDLVNKLKEIMVSDKPPQYYKELYDNNFSMDKIVSQFLEIVN